ncbi:MAG TPA: CoA-binding protein [Pseudomonadales bacterium]|nr:CoA-binding protein [Pseudomonadales bacterium]HNC70700.1 CoA-binding protein [Pseudomonadales bacterium]HND15165.1 CoA-binding protein [Pseudomonadales bacterium]
MRDGETVAILGASADPERYAFQAQRLLKEHGHRVVPVSTREPAIDGDAAVPDLASIRTPVDTVTVYVRPAISSTLREQLLALHPKRVIFNPGTENPELEATLRSAGITAQDACTLVLLRTGEY